MRKPLIGILTFCLVLCSLSVTFAAKSADILLSHPDPEVINFIYDPDDGNIALHIGESLLGNDSQSLRLTSLQIESEAGLFDGPDPPAFNTDFFDVYLPEKSFHIVTDGFGDLESFGNVGPGRTGQFLMNDFTINGSIKPKGTTDDFRFAIVVPEPSAWLLIAGAFGWIGLRVRR